MDREALARFDADTRAPLLAYPFVSSFSARVGGGDDRRLPAASGSFLSVDASNLQVVTLKEAEDGDGWILRLRETAARALDAELSSPVLHFKEAHLCNGVEENQRKLAVSANAVKFPVKPNQYVTLRLKLDSSRVKLARR
jgi:alpha-mannosidase